MAITLSPAYGRDYKSAKAVKADFFDDKDFIIEDFFNPYCGKPTNLTDCKKYGESQARIRFDQMRKVTVITF